MQKQTFANSFTFITTMLKMEKFRSDCIESIRKFSVSCDFVFSDFK